MILRDAPFAPELVVVPGFAIGRYAVTFEEFDYFCGQEKRPLTADEDWGRENNPVIHVT
jgi:formylglycine-generating enzyme required for sulfatase activity